MAAKLFGVALVPLFAAIAQVESEGGRTSENVYQLGDAYIEDVNRISRDVVFADSAAYAKSRAEQMMVVYFMYYGRTYLEKTGKAPTAEVLVRMHNGGPNGWRKKSTLRYWHRVKAAMDAAERAK